MKIRLLERFTPFNAKPGDTVELTYRPPYGSERVVARDTLEKAMSFDAAIIYDVEPGDLPNVDFNYGLGGAFLNTRRTVRSGRKEKKRWLPWLRR